MFNRRMGGMGSPNRGNQRSFSQQPFQGGLNPWQGGGPMQNNQGGGGLLSQITANPQQLALALTSLLQPQQQQMNPPSLLSLNTTPSYSNQGNRDFNDRFGNRGRDLRRHEPYNKNRQGNNSSGGGGWRTMDRGGNRNQQRNQGNNKRRSPQRDNRNKDDKNKKDDKKEAKSAEKKKDSNDAIDLSMDDDKEESKESKRDWKDEKNISEDKKSESGDEDSKEHDDKEKDARNKEGKYTGVPIKFLNCFVCNKEMWDGESMWKHIRGRAHSQMLKSLEENIHITVGILRENMRLSEEKKMIERSRVHRLKKFNKFNDEYESHCNMCDLKFLGKIITHRRTPGHQRLKRFLHPHCKVCEKEFPSRLDWIEHRLTPEHLRKLSEDLDSKIGEKDGMEIIDELEEEKLEPLLEEALQMEVENPILEVDENVENLQNLMPAYKKDRPVATKSLKPFSGFMCELCNRSFENEEYAQAHLKTTKHYHTFIGILKEKHKKEKKKEGRRQKEEKEENEKDEDEEKDDKNLYDPEEATNKEEEAEEEDDAQNSVVNEEEYEEEGDPSSISIDNSQLKDEDAEVEEAEEEKIAVKEEPEEVVAAKKPKIEPKKEPVTPAKGRPVRGGGNVKNGAGPKSKKART